MITFKPYITYIYYITSKNISLKQFEMVSIFLWYKPNISRTNYNCRFTLAKLFPQPHRVDVIYSNESRCEIKILVTAMVTAALRAMVTD